VTITPSPALAARVAEAADELVGVGWNLERGLPAASVVVTVDARTTVVRIGCAHPDDVDVWADEFLQTHALLAPPHGYGAELVEPGGVRIVATCTIAAYTAARGNR
jgi:hypothetical protein